jgi:hypothetical protein
MIKRLQFGIFIQQIVPIPRMIEQCRFVGALGYDSTWLFDQFYNPLRVNDPLWEASTQFAATTASTGYSIGRHNHKHNGFQPIEASRLHMAMSTVAISSVINHE